MSKGDELARSSWFRGVTAALGRFDARLPILLKFSLPLLAVGLAMGGIGTWTVYRMEAGHIRSDFEERALLTARSIEVGAAHLEPTTPAEAGPLLEEHLRPHIAALVQDDSSILLVNVYAYRDGAPTMIVSSEPGLQRTPHDAAADFHAVSSGAAVTHEEKVAGQDVLEVLSPLRIDGHLVGVVGTYIATQERDKKLAALLRTSVIALGGELVLGIAMLFLAFRFLVFRRLQRLLAATERVAAGDYSARVEGMPGTAARDEVLQLSARFNAMADAIQTLHGELEEQASTDSLTGLFNRRYALEALERECARARRSGEPLAGSLVDVDRLKELNDRCGHATGDEALRQVAEALRGAVRASDLVARFGGDEFLIVLAGCDGGTLRSTLERVQVAVAELEVMCGTDGAMISVAVSAGGATLRPGDTADALIQRADTALYGAKRAGRSQVRLAA